MSEAISKLVVGNAVEESTDCGPLIRPREVDRVHDWIKEAKQQAPPFWLEATKSVKQHSHRRS